MSFDVTTMSHKYLLGGRFDYVINCIGIIKPFVEKVGIANTILINSVFPHQLADWCYANDTKFIHITTDCVFSGKKGCYTEEDVHDVMDVYGRSKSMGEPVANAMTIRTSIIGEEVHNNASLVEWAKSMKGKSVNGFTNHLWNGVTTKQYARICSTIMERGLYDHGLFHAFSPSAVTKWGLLMILNDRFELGLDIVKVQAGSGVDRTLGTVKDLCAMLNIPELRYQIAEM
jgi:dTDP-4-dehydrorhamnose reductase